ncbi:MAG: hypothetical protein AB4058_12940 [Microcystaceae cyanobacterium]
MISQDSTPIEVLLQQAKLEHQTVNDAQQDTPDATNDLLSQLKQNHRNKGKQTSNRFPEAQDDFQGIRQSQQQKKQALVEGPGKMPDDTNDDLLKQFKQAHQTQGKPAPNHSSEAQDDFQGIRQSQQQKKQTLVEEQEQTPDVTDDLLTNLKAQHQTPKKKDYNVNVKEIRQTEQEKQQKIKRLTKQATLWLDKLDPYSDEGFWFGKFAESYPSRLDAAIEYLGALEE